MTHKRHIPVRHRNSIWTKIHTAYDAVKEHRH